MVKLNDFKFIRISNYSKKHQWNNQKDREFEKSAIKCSRNVKLNSYWQFNRPYHELYVQSDNNELIKELEDFNASVYKKL